MPQFHAQVDALTELKRKVDPFDVLHRNAGPRAPTRS